MSLDIDQNHIDKLCIQQILSGDTERFAQIVDTYKDQIAGVCINMLKDKNLAEEVGQETFIRLFKSLDKYKFQSSLGTYLTRIAINLCLNKLDSIKRRNNRFRSQETSDLKIAADIPNQQITMENQQLVEMALAGLKPESRSVVVLRMIEGYNVIETSEILGIAEGTVMSKLNRAMKQMKKTLTHYIK